jgi:hypothetical protein
VLSGQTVETGFAAQVHLDEAQLQFRTVTTVSVGSHASILRRLARGVNSRIDDCLLGGVHSIVRIEMGEGEQYTFCVMR